MTIMKFRVISLNCNLLYFSFSNVAGILACSFTKKWNPLLSFCKCASVNLFLKIFVSSHSEMFSKITVLHLWLKAFEKYLSKSSIFIKAVGWRSGALLTMNFFTCILMIFDHKWRSTTRSCSRKWLLCTCGQNPWKIYVKELNFCYKVVWWRQL